MISLPNVNWLKIIQNASINLLTSFSLFVLELNREEFNDPNDNPIIQKAQELYRNGFKRLHSLPSESWEDIKSLMLYINKKVVDFNPAIKGALEKIEFEILLHRTNNKLRTFLNKKTT